MGDRAIEVPMNHPLAPRCVNAQGIVATQITIPPTRTGMPAGRATTRPYITCVFAISITVTALSLLLGACSPARASKLVSASDLSSRLETILRIYNESGYGSGTLAVIRPDETYIQGLNLATDAPRVLNEKETFHYIASVSKHLAATAILRLEEMGRLKVSDKLSSIFKESEWPAIHLKGSNGKEVTINHLLHHSSGIPEVYTEEFEKTRVFKRPVPFNEFLGQIKNRRLNHAPGSKFEYSNIGYLILGEIVRRKSGRSYREFIHQQLFKAHGIDEVFVTSLPPSLAGRLAHGYELNPSDFTREDYFEKHGIRKEVLTDTYADTNAIATAGGLARWLQKLGSGQVLSGDSMKKMFTPKLEAYGAGFFIADLMGHKAYFHSGDWFGFNSFMYYFPNERVSVVYLGNQVCENRAACKEEAARAFKLSVLRAVLMP